MFCAADVHAGAHQAARDALHRRAGMSRTPKSSIQLETTLTNLAATALTQTNSHAGLAPSEVGEGRFALYINTHHRHLRSSNNSVRARYIHFPSIDGTRAPAGSNIRRRLCIKKSRLVVPRIDNTLCIYHFCL